MKCRRFLTILLMLALSIGALILSASAATIVASSNRICSPKTVTWTLDSEGTLEFSGYGELYQQGGSVSYRADYTDVYRVVINEGITSIGDRAFQRFYNLTSVTIPSSVKCIEKVAFDGCCNLNTIIFAGDAPVTGESAFSCGAATAYYPAGNATWTKEARQNWGSNLTWKKMETLSIATQPKTSYTQKGATAKATVSAKGVGLTYQWYVKSAGSSKYSKSSNQTATYKVTMSDASKDRQVYCVVTDALGNTVKSKVATLRMAPTITTQPKSVTAAQGKTAKITLKAQGDGLTYTWYFKNKGASKFSKTTTFTGNTYTISSMDASRNGRQVYCVVKDKYGNTVKTDVVTLKLKQTAKITTQPKSVTVAKGKTAKVTLKATGDGLTYQWYYKNPGATKFSLTKTFTGNTYSIPKMDKARSGRQIYCVITDQYGNSLKSNTVTLKMK